MSNDPLEVRGADRVLFEQVWKMMLGQERSTVCEIGLNLIVNVIRQSVGKRKDAEELFNQLFGKAKSTLLDEHYDSVTGLRRNVFPFTQVIQAPFHDEGNVIFHGK
jgi:hypothetical protein